MKKVRRKKKAAGKVSKQRSVKSPRSESAKVLERMVAVPAVVLEKVLKESKEVRKKIRNNPPLRRAESFWHKLGPGLTTGAADDDPSGITTYSQTGARYGFQLLWLAGFTFPLMALIQEMCARIGLVTGKGLAANIREHYPRPLLYFCAFLLLVANSFNIGANLGAMAKTVQLLVPDMSFVFLVSIFTILSLLLQIFTTYERYAKYLKWLALILFSYVFTAFIVDLDWKEVAKAAVIPTLDFSKEQLLLITAILGTTISPYLFFWQTSQEVEERILEGKTSVKARSHEHTSAQRIKNMRIDVWSGMFISNLVMFFIIAVSAATLHAHGVTNIETAADAAEALRPLAGGKATWLFALGIIGTGLLAIPVLAGAASYAIAESFHWKEGLYRKLHQSYSFYGVLIIAMLIGLSINFTSLDPIKALIYSAVLNGLVAPIILTFIILLSSNQQVMKTRVNRPWMTALGWLTVVIMTGSGLATIIALLQ